MPQRVLIKSEPAARKLAIQPCHEPPERLVSCGRISSGSDSLQLAALCRPLTRRERAYIGIDRGDAHGIGRPSRGGAPESLKIVSHRRMRRKRMRRWGFAAGRNGNVPSRGVLRMRAITNLDPALRAINGDAAHEGCCQNRSQQGAGAGLESDHDSKRIAVGERAAARCESRPYLLWLS